jgi:DNA-binding CsgD family transcriptional regulator
LWPFFVAPVPRPDVVHGARAELAARADLPPAALAVARAVVEDDPDALVGAADGTGDQYTAAWLLLAAGERYRRAGRRRDARVVLHQAAALYEGLGAEPWVARAREELRASGATLRRRDQGDALTPSERRIAELAAEGRSNKEVAAALFLSPKTVEFHLGNAYRKLGVGNRTELAARLRDAPVNPEGSLLR